MAPADEFELVEKARDGDIEAFSALVEIHRRSIYLLALGYAGNHHDAEDLAQEAFLNAYRAIGRFRGDSAFRTWLSRIVVNAFLNRRRRNDPLSARLRGEADPDWGPVAAGFPAAASARTTENRLLVHEVMQFLGSVPPRQRLAFLMKHQEGQTCEEIAQALGTSVGTVKKALFRVVSKLRDEFGRVPERSMETTPCIAARASEKA